jgi:hypothetical protein
MRPDVAVQVPDPDDHGREAVTIRDLTVDRNRRSVFTEATIDCKALAAQIEAFCAVPARSLEASRRLDRYSAEPREGRASYAAGS